MRPVILFIIAAGLLVLVSGGLLWWSAGPAVPYTDDGRVPVATTLFPLYDMVQAIGGEAVQVHLILPAGADAHGFDPSPGDMQTLRRSALLVYTGAAMEPWVGRVRGVLGRRGPRLVDASGGLLGRLSGHHHGGCDGHDHHHDHDHDHDVDPHIWLDLGLAQDMVTVIADALAAHDPPRAADYAQRAAGYRQRLAELDEEIRQALAAVRVRTIISAGHFAFGRFAARYGLEHRSPYRGFGHDGEPTARAMATLLETLRQQQARHVFHEEVLPGAVARVLAEEAGVGLLRLHPGHNLSAAERAQGLDFISLMRANLEILRQGLDDGASSDEP